MSEFPGPESLPREIDPPPELEARVVSALHSQGLLKPASRIRWMQAAAAIALVAAGIAIGRAMAAAPANQASTVSGSRFLFMLTDAAVQADDRATAEAYKQWAVQQRNAGRQISGERLADSGVAVVRGGSAPIQVPEVQGFFVVSASNIDDAVAVARSSPHVQSGGTILIRPIDTP